MRHNDNKAKRGLAVYVSLFLLIVMGIVFSGYLSYRNFEQEFRRQVVRQISAIAELKVNDLVNWRKERLSDAQFLYHNPAFSALVERYFENPGDVGARELLLDQLDHLKGSTQYDRVRLLDVNGVERFSIPTTPDTLDADLAVDAARSLRSGTVAFLDFYHDASTGGEIHLTILVPIFVDKSNNTPLGVLALSINPQTYLYPYIQSWPIPSDTAETLLVRREGNEVLFLNKLRFGRDAPLTLHFPLMNTDLPAVKAVLGQTGAVEGVDYRDEPVLADVRAVPGSPWFLVSKMDTAEVYAPLRARLWQILLISGMAIFLAGMGLALIWRQQRNLFYRTKVEAMEALRGSEEKMRSIFRVAPTGIGVVRDRVLVEVNPRITEMTGYTKEELTGKSARMLYPTQEEFEWVGSEKYKQIAEKGSGVVETRWQKKDGSIIEILLASTPIDLADLSKGVTFTALDITERKQTERALRDSQQLFQAVMDNIPQRIFWKDSQLVYLGCNSAFAASVGLASSHDIVGKTDWDLPSKHAELYRADDNFVMKSGIPKLNFEEPQTTPDCVTSWLRTSKVPMRNVDGDVYAILGLYEDISERKRAEDVLRKRNKYLLALQETALELVSQLDLNILLENIVRRAGQIMGTTSGYLDLVEPVTGQLIPRIGLDALAESLIHDVQPGEGLAGIVWQTGKPLIVNDYDEWAGRIGSYTLGKIRAAVGVPLLSSGKILGVLGLAYGTDKTKSFDDEDVNLLEQFAQLAAIAIINASLFSTAQQELIERKRAEEALRESEERLRLAVSAGRMGTWDRNFLSGKLDWSVECKAIFGLAPEVEMNDERFMQALHPEDREVTDLAVREALEKQTDFNMEYRVIWPDGTIHWIAAQGHGYYNEAGQAIHMAGISLDITSRKQAEEALRESEALYRQAIEVANAVPYRQSYHVNGKTVEYDFISEGIRQITGYGPEEFDENLWDSLIQESVLLDELAEHRWIEAIQRVRSGVNPVWKCEHRIRARDGSIHWVFEAAVELRDQNGVSHGSIGTFQDITERKQAEEALRESEALYRQAIEVANAVPYRQSYHVNDKTVDYDFIGEGIRQITGYGPEEFNEALWDSLAQERILLENLVEYSFDEAIERVRSGVDPVWKCNHRIRARDGKIHWVFEAAVELRDQNGISHGSIGMFQDITGRKQAEDEIRKLNAELEQRVHERTVQLETTNKELEAFSYSVSHDLRAPLRGIDGWSLALLEDYHDQLDEQGQQYIARVRSETQRMGYLIDDMLKLSRLTRVEMIKKQVDLNNLAHIIIERLQKAEPMRKVDFNIQAGLTVQGDLRLLEVMLTNLLGNAFKFTAKCADARIEFGQTELQGQRVFYVRDNGAGFDMAYSQKLFGAFQRMHKSSEFPGSGIGLATAQRIVHRHGGRVWADAEVGRGATFYFTLG